MVSDSRLRILYVGPVLPGSTTRQRLEAMRELGHTLHVLNTENKARSAQVRPPLLARVRRRLFGPEDRSGANAEIQRLARIQPFDLAWIDKGLTIRPAALQCLRATQPRCRIVGFSPDDMINPANQSSAFLRGLPLYHYYVTTKSYNVAELEGLGCPKVLFMENGYDPHTHRPVPVTAGDRERLGGAVGFIGQWEPDRAASLGALARAGLPVRVWGYTWERMRGVPPGLRLENRPLWGDDYARGICAFDLNLCFLRKCNRDLQTTRSIEIPACGGFMLAERTEEHLRLFEEGAEAEFFSSNEELLRKTKYYIQHDGERRRVAQRGYERCQRDGYSYPDRLRGVMRAVRDL
jgi:hypothetical protein